MNTSANPERQTMRSPLPTSALAKSVSFDEALMHVTLRDGRIIGVPLAWFPILRAATPAQRMNYEICGGGGYEVAVNLFRIAGDNRLLFRP